MKREDFKKIIKLRSVWKIDRRRGDYMLPGKGRLSMYIGAMVRGQMEIDGLAIAENGDFYYADLWDQDNEAITIYKEFQENETCTREAQEKRIRELIGEIIG